MSASVMRSKSFDWAFIWLPFLIAVSVGIASKTLQNPFFIFVFVSWVFGYGHATALFSRLYLDAKTRSQHWFLAWYLPVLCFLFTLALYKINPILIPTFFVLSRFFHYIRQSHGFARIIDRTQAQGIVHNFFIYVLPTLLLINYLPRTPTLIGNEIRMAELQIYFPYWFILTLISVTVLWFVTRYVLASSAEAKNYHSFMFTHVLIFILGYVVFYSLEVGIIMLAIWHGAQYMMFVWHFNNRRSTGRSDAYGRLFSTDHILWATVALALVTIVIYGGLNILNDWLAIQAFMIGTMTINFHHYIADAFIWKRSKTE